MGCQSEVYIGANLTFSITTHDPDTGVLTDTDAPPIYRVYENETAVAILTGTMAKLDDANTTGFYTELIACTTGNGFENNKSYTIYIEATVDTDTGGICYGFRAITSSTKLSATYTQLKAAMKGNDIDILRGDTLDLRMEGLGNISLRDKLWFTVKNDKDDADTGAWIQVEETAGLLYINGAAAATPANGSITVTDAITGKITVALAAVETAKLADMGNLYWDVQMLAGLTVTTLVRGRAVIVGDSTRATS